MTDPLPDFEVTGDGPRSLVFLHGLGGDLTNWQPQVEFFANSYRCLSWTLPGYGSSAPLETMTWETLANALVQVLDQAGIDQTSIIGLSMGGFIAQQFAADHPERVDQLVLAGTTAQFGRGSESFAQEFLRTRLAPIDDGATPADFATNVVENLLSPSASSSAVENAVASMSNISPQAYRQALECLVSWNFVPRLATIQAQTLCIAASNDRTAPVPAVRALADGLPHARLHVLEHCQHLMNLDCPDAFNQVVEQFLAQPGTEHS